MSNRTHLLMSELERDIKDMEKECAINDTPENTQRIAELRAKYYDLTANKALSKITRLKQNYYEQGESSGKLLAWRLKTLSQERAITEIETEGGITTNPAEINDAFRKYYRELYASEVQYPNDQDKFLDELPIPLLEDMAKQKLDSPITKEEIFETLVYMSSGKAPGPDGLPLDFFKHFKKWLIPPLFDMLVESVEAGQLPPSLSNATISLILKPNKPPTNCASYRPISLINSDAKIIAKVFARRLEKHLPSLIAPDQNGFIKDRQAFHNIHRVLNIIHAKQECTNTAIVSLDAKSAFDMVEHGYLFDILRRFGFGDYFCSFVKMLYRSPSAAVTTNLATSEPFQLQRGTRQGCPLSPLLFALAIEPLAIAVRQSRNITGIKIGDAENKIGLFADDILLFLTQLRDSIPNLLELINTFGSFSGYTVNKSKSNILFLNQSERISPPIQTPFTNTSSFTYLGIKITPTPEDLVTCNYKPVMDSVTNMIKRWSAMPISMVGRINSLKMTILPKFLYLFQCIPLPPPPNFFTSMNKLFRDFIWNNRKARLRLTLLYLPFDRGGLKLPNLKLYYWSCQLWTASFWFKSHLSLSWVDIERFTSTNLPLQLYLYSAKPGKLKKNTDNPFVRNTLYVWHEVHKYLKDISKLSQFTPIWGNENFPPATMDKGFKLWADKGIAKIADLFQDGVLMSFEKIKQKFDLPAKHFFKYLQIRDFIHKTQKNISLPKLSAIENIAVCVRQRGVISMFYKTLLLGTQESSEEKRLAWCIDLKQEITDSEWQTVCKKSQTQTCNAGLKLIQYKWVMRLYITPEVLHKFNVNTPDVCVKCVTCKGTLIHCLWSCTKLQSFWREVIQVLSAITETDLPLCPKLCILGLFPKDIKLNSTNRKMITLCLLQARRTIAHGWKSTLSPSVKCWLENIVQVLPMEKITYSLKGKHNVFEDIWSSFLEFIGGPQFLLALN